MKLGAVRLLLGLGLLVGSGFACASAATTAGDADSLVAKVRIQLRTFPSTASVGQTVSLKGRVRGKDGASRVRIIATGADTVVKRTKADGRFGARVRIPADRKIKVCVGTKCAIKRVPDVPDMIDYAWTDSQGYSFSTVVLGMALTNINVDTLNAPPGEAIISLGFAGTQAITNTTDGRNATPGRTWLQPVFPASSTLCQTTGDPNYSHFWATVPVYQETGEPDAPPIPYCAFRGGLGVPTGAGVGTLGPAQTAYNDFSEAGAPGLPYVISFSVQEAQAATIVNDLKHPAFWGLSRGLGGTTTIPIGQCFATLPVVDTSRNGLTVCAQGVQ